MIFSIIKPIGWTSFDVVKKIRGITKHKKVGHAGTLDPFATGILIIGTEKDTKSLQKISSSFKIYEAVLKLGQTTNTLDIEGEITSRKEVPLINSKKINMVFQSLLGESSQIPPMFSAKKVNGQRLYKLARKGISIKRDPIKINIKKLELLDHTKASISFRVECSKGTYIRVLGKSISEKLSTIGFLTSLKRIQVGDYNISDSITLQTFEKRWK